MNKRKHHRIAMPNLEIQISNGTDSFSGTVSDVSRDGMLLGGIPQDLSKPNEILSVVVFSKGKEYKMLAMPRWMCNNSRGKNMGVELLEAPVDWSDFVREREPKDEHTWKRATFLPDS